MVQLIVLIVSCVLCYNAGYDGAMADFNIAIAVVTQSFEAEDIGEVGKYMFRSRVAVGAALCLNLIYYFYSSYKKNRKNGGGP